MGNLDEGYRVGRLGNEVGSGVGKIVGEIVGKMVIFAGCCEGDPVTGMGEEVGMYRSVVGPMFGDSLGNAVMVG